MSHLSLTLFESFYATVDGQPITRLTSRKAQALLAYLIIEHAHPHSRESLATLLWPDLPERDTLRKFRHTLSDLRQALGISNPHNSFLLISRNMLQFNMASSHNLDVALFEQQVSAIHALHAQLAPIRSGGFAGEAGNGNKQELSPIRLAASRLSLAGIASRNGFLPDLFIDSASFEEWLQIKRQQFHWQFMRALQQLGEIHEALGQYEQAQICARRQIELESWREEAHRQLMRALALNGERSMALIQYQACLHCLNAELGVGPDAETVELYQAIIEGKLSSRISQPPSPVIHTATLSQVPAYTHHPALFVDRRHELARLEHLLDAALHGHGSVAFIIGEVGSGKTALASEFVRCAMAKHTDLLATIGQCHTHIGSGDPYLPFRQILQMLAGDYEAYQAACLIVPELSNRLNQACPAFKQDLANYGYDLIDRFVSRSLLQHTDPILATRTLGMPDHQGVSIPYSTNPLPLLPNQQIAAVLFALTRRSPLIVILDDLHWADRESINLMSYLGRHLGGNRILIIGTYQPARVTSPSIHTLGGWRSIPVNDSTPPEPSPFAQALGQNWDRHPLESVVYELRRRFGITPIDLDQADGRQLVTALLDREPNTLDASFRQLLYCYTAGNPLFTLAMLDTLKANGSLVRNSSGAWAEGAHLDWNELPPQVEAAIAENIGRLHPIWQTIMAIASVEGEEFTAEVVSQVSGVALTELIGMLRSEHGLVYYYGRECANLQGTQHLSRYRFRHRLTQQYLYHRLEPTERAWLHQAIDQTLAVLQRD
ncbi:MAG: AAA family ATPase [Oscillochloris sp.]|nr:AAA family ATPase [Oscillochloris sp.]